ncbi:MAG: hypothetical protein R3B37_15660 [Nitrospira sp.]|nr:hypothetical protein [Nitrospira sp.]
MPTRFAHTCCAAWILCCWIAIGIAPSSSLAATRVVGIDVFAQFTQHIERQADTDKQAFAVASQCMNWFYKQQRHKPAPPTVERIAWTQQANSRHIAAGSSDQTDSDCRARYPGGIDAVRSDFQRTQAFLSLSLTFYEFALVGDGDDNATYSDRELQDILLALNLASEPSLGADAHLRSLTSQFDSLHKARGMEALMTGMGKLYDQGYRVTTSDKNHLNRVME